MTWRLMLSSCYRHLQQQSGLLSTTDPAGLKEDILLQGAGSIRLVDQAVSRVCGLRCRQQQQQLFGSRRRQLHQ